MAESWSSLRYRDTRRQVLGAIRAAVADDEDPARSYLDLLEGLAVDSALERDGELTAVRRERDAALLRARRAASERDAALAHARELPAEVHAWLNDLAVAHPDHAALISELADLFERRWLGQRARTGAR